MKGRVRSALSAWASSERQDQEALRSEYEDDEGTEWVRDIRDREIASVCGTLRTVTLRPSAGIPVLEAELYDGTGTVVIVWLGRRRISGIKPGRSLRVRGRVSAHGDAAGKFVMYNPHYELLP